MASGCERLLSEGHRDPFKYTPKKLVAFLEMARTRNKEDLAALFTVTRLAYHGKPKDAEKLMKELGSGRI